MGNGTSQCDPMNTGCKALSDAKSQLGEAMFRFVREELDKRDKAMNEHTDRVEARMKKQDGKLWWILALVATNAVGLAAYFARAAIAAH